MGKMPCAATDSQKFFLSIHTNWQSLPTGKSNRANNAQYDMNNSLIIGDFFQGEVAISCWEYS